MHIQQQRHLDDTLRPSPQNEASGGTGEASPDPPGRARLPSALPSKYELLDGTQLQKSDSIFDRCYDSDIEKPNVMGFPMENGDTISIHQELGSLACSSALSALYSQESVVLPYVRHSEDNQR